MDATTRDSDAGEGLVKQDVITREELEKAQAEAAKTGTPWYRQLIQTGKLSYSAVEDMLRYEFHSKSARDEHQNLGDTLVKMNALSHEQLHEALAEQKRTGRLLGNLLVENGYITHEVRAQALSRQYGLDFAKLAQTHSSREALETVPESMALKNNILPLSVEGDKLTVLIADPLVRTRLKDLAVLLGKRIHSVLTASKDFQQDIAKRYKQLAAGEATGAVKPMSESKRPPQPASQKARVDGRKKKEKLPVPPMQTPDTEAEVGNDKARFEEIAREASGAPVVKMVSTIIEGAVNSSATDIHLDPQESETRVRYRIDGILHDIMSIPTKLHNAVISRIKILSDLDITDTRHPQDGHISMDIGEREFDIRVASLPTFLGERLVLRLLDQSSVLSGIHDLGLEADDEKTMTRLIDQPYGMILVTGPTGSGKTTTLYAALNQKNVMTDSIVTLEDPVEYQLGGINQVQIDPDIEMTFANTLRAALRQDIDVLLVGEIRDSETARIAIRAAMTGHLVFSTLHTNDAPEAVSTLRNMGIPSYLIASALTAVVGQRLVRTICEDCRTSFKPTATLLKAIGLPANTRKLYRGKGCSVCYNTGNRGRTGIFEVMEITPEVRKLIAEDAAIEKIIKATKLKSMAVRCREKVKRGIVTPEEYLRVIRT